jgi:exoribonuclease-2
LNFHEDRLAVVVELLVGADGSILGSDVYQAWVTNHARLAYNAVAAWLRGADAPQALSAVSGLDANLRIQDATAQRMQKLRHVHGALSLETIEAKPVFDGDQLRALEIEEQNAAKGIIEEFMIAANVATARFLSDHKYPSIRRVVRTPKRWDRIVEIAREHHVNLPDTPDSKVLEEFLVAQKAADPLRFPDLSLAVIKLLGSGEYVAEHPDGNAPGHFGLAVKDYAHTTAPNRRYPDLFAQRLLQAAMAGQACPYSEFELDVLATHCTQAEDSANKVERQVGKSAAALLLESRLGEQFDAVVTGASEKGTWVRLLSVPVEGRLMAGFDGLDVGNQLRVKLASVDVQKGFIDFERAGSSKQ